MLNNTFIYSEVYKNIITSEAASMWLEQIDNYLDSLYEINNKSKEENLNLLFPSESAEVIKNQLKAQGINLEDIERVKNYLIGLKESLQNAKLITITLAVKPDDKLLNDIYTALEKVIGGDCALLEIKINKEILGGAEIIWKGQYFEHTLKKKVEEYFSI